jgi:hypothetical protein
LIYSDNRSYVFLITNPDKVTSHKSYPKGHQFEFKITNKHLGSRFNEHVKKCKVSLNSSTLFVPHIQKNETYQYLLAHRKQELFKITDYFMCFDLETTEQKTYDLKLFEPTGILSEIIPITIAVSYHSKSELKTDYSDIRSGNDFIHQILSIMFEKAKIISEDNMYEENKKARELRLTNDEKLIAQANELDIIYKYNEV